MFTLLLIYSHCFIINPVITSRMIRPTLVITNSHSIWSPHTMSPLNDDVSHVYTLCYPSMLIYPMDPHYVPLIDDRYHGSKLCPPSMIMAPMYPHYVPLIYDGSHGSLQYALLIDYGSHGSTLFTTQLWCLPRLPPIFPPSTMMDPSWLKLSLLHTWPTTQLGKFSCSLFDDILTPPIFNLQRGRSLLEVGNFSYLYTHVDKCLLQGVRR